VESDRPPLLGMVLFGVALIVTGGGLLMVNARPRRRATAAA
jgi:hypothetical protein